MGVITLVFMSLMCVAAIRISVSCATAPQRYLMPLWPFVPAALLVSFALMATSQTAKDAPHRPRRRRPCATIYYLAPTCGRAPTRKWVMLGAVEEPGEWARPGLRHRPKEARPGACAGDDRRAGEA